MKELLTLIEEALGFADAARTCVGSMTGRGWDIDDWQKKARAALDKHKAALGCRAKDWSGLRCTLAPEHVGEHSYGSSENSRA